MFSHEERQLRRQFAQQRSLSDDLSIRGNVAKRHRLRAEPVEPSEELARDDFYVSEAYGNATFARTFARILRDLLPLDLEDAEVAFLHGEVIDRLTATRMNCALTKHFAFELEVRTDPATIDADYLKQVIEQTTTLRVLIDDLSLGD